MCGGGGLTFEQPEVNIMRGAYYALISALSGTQTMALCSYDEAYTIPTEYSARISLRTMQLLMDEMGLCDTVDPLAGSYYVETLTNQMREKMEAVMAEVDAEGGIVEMVKDGRIQAKVSEQAYDMHRDIESGTFPKVGVNRYRIEEEDEHEVEFHPYNLDDAEMQIESLRQVRSRRDGNAASAGLARVDPADPKASYREADLLLYNAKRSGRDQLCFDRRDPLRETRDAAPLLGPQLNLSRKVS